MLYGTLIFTVFYMDTKCGLLEDRTSKFSKIYVPTKNKVRGKCRTVLNGGLNNYLVIFTVRRSAVASGWGVCISNWGDKECMWNFGEETSWKTST